MSLSSLFGGDRTPVDTGGQTEGKVFGERYRGRYHLPLLPGEQGTKSGGDWVPGGVQSATNLAGAIVESRALTDWEFERAFIGMAREPSLAENIVYAVNHAVGVERVDPSFPKLESGDESESARAQRRLRATLADIRAQARRAGGGDEAARRGTLRHDVWEARVKTGELFGPPEVNRDILALEELLDREGLDRVSALSERTVRNVGLSAAGRFDNVLLSRRTGRLYMADLKTKRRAFFSWMEVWIQLCVYATAEWMLSEDGAEYVPGPAHHVDQESAIVLHMPVGGAAPSLARVDLAQGREWAELARAVCDARALAASAGVRERARWNEL